MRIIHIICVCLVLVGEGHAGPIGLRGPIGPNDHSLFYPDAVTYIRKQSEAAREAGTGDNGWNERYKAALAKRGLTISPVMPSVPDLKLYPHGGLPMRAPVPFGEKDAWRADSAIVWEMK